MAKAAAFFYAVTSGSCTCNIANNAIINAVNNNAHNATNHNAHNAATNTE